MVEAAETPQARHSSNPPRHRQLQKLSHHQKNEPRRRWPCGELQACRRWSGGELQARRLQARRRKGRAIQEWIATQQEAARAQVGAAT